MAQNKTEKKVPVIVDGVHGCSAPETYVPPKEPAVQEHLKWFRGLKLGLMMHWSPGSQMGSFESWPLCDEAGGVVPGGFPLDGSRGSQTAV